MPIRHIPFVNDQIYHIYNRGVEKRQIFENTLDYRRFVKTIRFYQLQGPKPSFSKFFFPKASKIDSSKKIIEILAYCLMPNHFHLLVKQVAEGGISEFASKLSNSYTKYYNTKHTRVGPLLQGEFKAVLVESDEQLLHLSRYIHLNPFVAYLTKDLQLYQWSSYKEYSDPKVGGTCDVKEILGFFKSNEDYRQFVKDQEDYALTLARIKKNLIDEED